MRRMQWLCMIAVMFAMGLAVPVPAADFPTKDLSGIICWGAGGATDNVSRGLVPYAEKALGKKIVLQNKPGATGSVGLMQVYNSPADGYTLLFAAENPPLYKVLDVGQIDYDDFYPVMLMARNVGVIVVNNDQPWKTLGDLFADAKKNPGQIKLGSTGAGGLPDVVSALLKATSGVTFNHIVFGGAGPAVTALLGGHVQMTVLGMAECREHLRAGRMRALAVVSDTPIPEIKDVPLITATSADYKKYPPLGSLLRRVREEGDPRRSEKGPCGRLPKRNKRPQGTGVHRELRIHLYGNFRGRSGSIHQEIPVHHDLGPPGCRGGEVLSGKVRNSKAVDRTVLSGIEISASCAGRSTIRPAHRQGVSP